jgi:hypothetical protein
MAKKRTGLQSEIAGIFSGVPVPKKGGTRSQSDSPEKKPDSPASKPKDHVVPKPVIPQPQVPVTPVPKKVDEPVPAAQKPKVIEIKAPEQVVKKTPKKLARRRKEKTFAPKSGVSSSRQKASITLLLFFSTALVIVLTRQYLIPPGNPNPPKIPSGASSERSTSAEIKVAWPLPPVYSEDLRDPMILGKTPPPPPSPRDVVVRGIVVSEDRKYAVIGTNYLQEGGIVPGTNIKVKKINPNSVEFEEDGKVWTQKVEGEKR